MAPSEENEMFLSDLRNDDGNVVSFSPNNGELTIFCGKSESFPEDDDDFDSGGGILSSLFDDRCSPSYQQCSSCHELQKGYRKIEILKRLFPSLSNPILICGLRMSGGSIEDAASFLSKNGAFQVNPTVLALPPIIKNSSTYFEEKTDENEEVVKNDKDEAIENDKETVTDVKEYVEKEMDSNENNERKEEEMVKNDRKNLIQKASEAEVPTSLSHLAGSTIGQQYTNLHLISCCKMCIPFNEKTIEREEAEQLEENNGENDTEERNLPPVVILDGGHEMIRIDSEKCNNSTKKDHHCPMCTSSIPSKEGGNHICGLCGLCEGCIIESDGSPRYHSCPGLLNGGDHHCHPLKYVLGGGSKCCDVGGPNCVKESGFVYWKCDHIKKCSFSVCCACVRLPTQKSSMDVRAPDENNRNEDSDNEFEEDKDNSFDDTHAENIVATQWEGTVVENSNRWTEGVVVVGTGEVGTTTRAYHPSIQTREHCHFHRRRRQQSPDTQNNRSNAVESLFLSQEKDLRENSVLSDDAERALDNLRSKLLCHGDGQNGNTAQTLVSATDVSHMEEILHKATTVIKDDENEKIRNVLHNAVSHEKFGVAGTLLLSQFYAPREVESKEAPLSENNGLGAGEESGEMICCCGEKIDVETAPDGSVGCLNGHAMHGSCAADVLLSGGSCPICREPLYFPRVSATETNAATNITNSEKEMAHKLKIEKLKLSLKTLKQTSGKEFKLSVGDRVLVCDDESKCKTKMVSEPRSGGWKDEMAIQCGKEGIVTSVNYGKGLTGDKHGAESDVIVAVNVSTGVGHSYKIMATNHKCRSCNRMGPSSRFGRFYCSHCSICESCCGDSTTGDELCPPTLVDWAWHPSLLEPISLSELNETEDEKPANKETIATREIERHFNRLQAELKAISMARENLKMEEIRELEMKKKPSIGRELSNNSTDALQNGLLGTVSGADFVRAHHLLLLAREWGDSEKAKSIRKKLYGNIRDGELDSVARTVRRYNTHLRAEEMKWADACVENGEYIVKETSKIHLKAYPDDSAPMTGYSLEPGTRFHVQKEILDDKGGIWLEVDHGKFPDQNIYEPGKNVNVDTSDPSVRDGLIGARVRRGPDWIHEERDDGGEGNEGVITRVSESGKVFVRWDGSFEELDYVASLSDKHELVFVSAPPLPPQGWLCLYPGGKKSPSVVVRAKNALRCFGCGFSLIPHHHGGEEKRFTSVKYSDVKKGDVLAIAATMKRVVVESCANGLICCSFCPTTETDNPSISVWYRTDDLVCLGNEKQSSTVLDDEAVMVDGEMRTRRELVLYFGGDKVSARGAWEKAKKNMGSEDFESDGEGMMFASCTCGHLLHSRCFQGALLSGNGCPAPGCSEPLWFPKVQKLVTDETCCGNNISSNARMENNVEAMNFVKDLSAKEGIFGGDCGGEEFDVGSNFGQLKMCPMCFAGPLFNENCSDLQAHHGQCTSSAMDNVEGDECTEYGPYHATPDNIAERIMKRKPGESVADVLPKCPKHGVLIMFNGCLACGHLFTNKSWDSLPGWDPKAKALLEIDKKKRHATHFLLNEIRAEAGMLEFERDALSYKREVENGMVDDMDDMEKRLTKLASPPSRSPLESSKVLHCLPNCGQRHDDDGDCLVCGLDWSNHNNHRCYEGNAVGIWEFPA